MGYLHKLLIAGAAIGVLTQPSMADTMVGRVVSAAGPNSVEREGPTVPLSEGSYVFQEDVIYTGSDASLLIEWFDTSETSIGSNSMIFVRELLQSEHSPEYQLTGNISASGAQD